MNNQRYGGIQWIQHHVSAGDSSEVDILESDGGAGATGEDLDHMAAENLIFMARDGQLSEIMAANESGGTVLVTSSGRKRDGRLSQVLIKINKPAACLRLRRACRLEYK